MTTRREIITKCGAGLASILAARRAPAALVRSMLAARNGIAVSGGGGGGGWTNPYITSGLIAMWDGEWNAGGGVHDADAMTWKDLVGSNDLTIGQSYESRREWVDGALGFNLLSNSKTVVGRKIQGMKFLEIVLMLTEVSKGGMALLINGYVRGVSTLLFCTNTGIVQTYNYNVKQGYAAGTLTNNVRVSLSFNTETPTDLRTFKNGSPTSVYQSADGWANGLSDSELLLFTHPAYNFNGGRWEYFFCIRAYSRALTDAEVAANYAVDAARFNHPTT